MTDEARRAATAGVRFPSDLTPNSAGLSLQLAGRVTHCSEFELTVADAGGRTAVMLRERPCVSVGDWVLLSGIAEWSVDGPRLTQSVLQQCYPGQCKNDGQFARFANMGVNLRRRAAALAAVRRFFEARDFLEVSTPTRVRAPGTDVYLEPQSSGDHWLVTSPEFHLKRLVVGGFPRLFEFARCMRRGEVGPWHLPEFTMLEWYSLLQDFEGLMQQTQDLVLHVAAALGTRPNLRVNHHQVALDRGFERLTVAEAFANFAGVDDVIALAAEDEDRYFQLMVDLVDPALARIPRPVLLTHYPLSQAALSAPSSSHEGCAERFELFIGGVELCNGYNELTCAVTQRARFEDDVAKRAQKNLPQLPIDEGLIAALAEGMPPCSGNALGFDRLTAVLLEQPLQAVVSFPLAE